MLNSLFLKEDLDILFTPELHLLHQPLSTIAIMDQNLVQDQVSLSVSLERNEFISPVFPMATSHWHLLSNASNYNPSFYDTLSRVELTFLARKEVDRRKRKGQLSPIQWAIGCPQLSDIDRFARQGGPDLSGLRGVSLRFNGGSL